MTVTSVSDTDAVRVIPNADGQSSVAYGVMNAAGNAWVSYLAKNGSAYFSRNLTAAGSVEFGAPATVNDFRLKSSGDTWLYQHSGGSDKSFFGYRASNETFVIGTYDSGYLDRLVVQRVSGNVGIGTNSPRAALDVQGALTGKPATSNATATIDFGAGNLQYTTLACQAFALWNMKDGASYTFAVQNNTSATCSFTAYSGAGTGALTFHLPPDHAATTANKHTVYTFIVLGSHVYSSWIAGY